METRHELLDNVRVVKKRFESRKKTQRTDYTLYERYDSVVENYLQHGICEDVPAKQDAEQTNIVKLHASPCSDP